MNFNLEDPLDNLLSDNSNDNDSFFESNPTKKKNIGKSALSKSTGGKGKMEDLFGIKEESEKELKIPPIRTTMVGGIKQDKAIATSTPKSKTIVEESDDILLDLGFDPKKPKSSVTTKSNLFDDILSSVESKKQNLAVSTKTEELSVRKDDGTSTRGTISRQSTDTTDNSAILGQGRSRTTTGRRSSTTPPANNNPLNLFSTSKDVQSVATPKARKKASTADWLGLGTESEEEPPKMEIIKQSESPKKVDVLKNVIESEEQIISIPIPVADTVPVNLSATVNQIPFLMTSSNLGAQNAVEIINQQESHITFATQLKNQEVALLDMQRRQQDLLSRQEIKFNELLQKQFFRQNQLEQNIKAQQERINAHLQLFMTQTESYSYPLKEDSAHYQRQSDNKEQDNKVIELEAEVKRLECEKLRLEDLLSNINAYYEKEIEMMDKSFRKQIKLLEDHLDSAQSRLQNEVESLHKFYTEKLKSADDDKREVKTQMETDLRAVKNAHIEEIERLKKAQEENLQALQDDYQKMLQTIRQSKILEFAIVQENGSYLQTLRAASNNLESVSGDLQSLRNEIQNNLDIVHRERELKLEAREKKLNDSERRLKIIEEGAENEKCRLMDLVASLESQLLKLSNDSSEQNWIMRQKMASLEADKLSFEKEKNLVREQMSGNEKRIEELKENQLAETQRQMQLIQEQRIQLNIEKAKLETAKKLDVNRESERSRFEFEAALKVAQDAARQADVERERLFKLQRQFESQKRELIDKENLIRSKEEELEKDIIQVRTSERRTHEATQKARSAEQNFNEKIVFLQQKMRDLSEKESALSQERLSLSQQRIELQNLKGKLEQNKCSLCRIGERNVELSHLLRPYDENNAIPVIDDNRFTVAHSVSSVDQLLDDNIAQSLARMIGNPNQDWSKIGNISDETSRPNENIEPISNFTKYDLSEDFLRNL